MASPSLVIIGYTNIDENITPASKTVSPGGAAYFAAVAASRLLQDIGLVTRIGKDFDTSFLLSRVLPDGVHIIPDKLSPRSTQIYHNINDPTDRDIILELNVAHDLNSTDIPPSFLQSAKYIHVATMPPLHQKQFIEYIKSKAPQIKLSIDTDAFLLSNPDNKQLIESNFMNCDLVFANRTEYQALKECIHSCKEAVVKMDKDGAWHMNKGSVIYKVPAKQVDYVDVTGAGDIFAGTYLASIVNGLSITEALSKAADVATHSIIKQGIDHLFV
jgi:sugar/nucleoside kinase (ribokinase family)